MNYRFVFVLLTFLFSKSLLSQNNYTSASFNLKGNVKSVKAKYDTTNLVHRSKILEYSEILEFSLDGGLIKHSPENIHNYTLLDKPENIDSVSQNLYFPNKCKIYDSLGYLIFEWSHRHVINQEGELHFDRTYCYLYNEYGDLSEIRSYIGDNLCDYETTIKKEGFSSTFFTYEYDINGNWTVKNKLDDTTLRRSISRKIVYFEE